MVVEPPARLVRIELNQVIGADDAIAAACFGGVLQSVVFAELRLLGRGPARTHQTPCLTPGDAWQCQVFEFALSEAEIASRVFHLSVMAIDMFGFTSTLGEAHMPLSYFEAEKHLAEIATAIPLFEYDGDVGVQTCALQLTAAVWTPEDTAAGTVIERWECERYSEGWSTENLLDNDGHHATTARATPPTVPPLFVPSLGWLPEPHPGDDHGWFYASSFDGPWHNSSGSAFVCRQRRLVRRCLPAERQATKQEVATLLRQDHAVTVDRLLATQTAYARLEAHYRFSKDLHQATVFRMEHEAAKALAAATTAHAAELAAQTAAAEAATADAANLEEQVAALRVRMEAAELENHRWRYANEQRASKKQLKVERRLKPLSTAPRLLRVHLVRCADLAAADSALMGGKSDPYIVLTVGDLRRKSTQFDNELNPAWDHEVFEFSLTEGALYSLPLVVRVFDHDSYNADELIGSATIPLDSVADAAAALAASNNDGEAEEQTFPLEVPSEFAAQKVASRIVLRFDVVPPPATVLELWENQRYAGRRWAADHLLPTDRQAWVAGAASAACRAAVEPPVPSSLRSALGWCVDRAGGDAHGWFYAKSFDGPWVNTSNASSVVRRRLWSNTCHRTEAPA
ncbi:C2 domain-containing protein [Achlya hypogyna]|uniref:C2 domain-containing protein n=1 Tax=Achlya hypogyna TaxID=1202772 RepID=A0A1V9YG12_ACHHY|nr:C2 domain-containing protein [Achlya hypogyna]